MQAVRVSGRLHVNQNGLSAEEILSRPFHGLNFLSGTVPSTQVPGYFHSSASRTVLLLLVQRRSRSNLLIAVRLIFSIGLAPFSHVQGQLHAVAEALLVEDATDVTLYGS